MKIAVIDYNAGNTRSVLNALARLGVEAELTGVSRTILAADRVILPGVGEASSAMKYLRGCGLDRTIREIRSPLLGICLGMQILCERSEEGDCECLGIVPGTVRKFREELKVPHMGWNRVRFERLNREDFFYFAHSYYLEVGDCSTAFTEYRMTFSAAIQRNNFLGVQFHPEKSGPAGARLLESFLRWGENFLTRIGEES